jgi:hypothetical protein
MRSLARPPRGHRRPSASRAAVRPRCPARRAGTPTRPPTTRPRRAGRHGGRGSACRHHTNKCSLRQRGGRAARRWPAPPLDRRSRARARLSSTRRLPARAVRSRPVGTEPEPPQVAADGAFGAAKLGRDLVEPAPLVAVAALVSTGNSPRTAHSGVPSRARSTTPSARTEPSLRLLSALALLWRTQHRRAVLVVTLTSSLALAALSLQVSEPERCELRVDGELVWAGRLGVFTSTRWRSTPSPHRPQEIGGP